MRNYFITVRNEHTAFRVDPNATLVRVLPETVHVRSYCCKEPDVSRVPPAYIYQVSVEFRREAEKADGVIKCRANEPKEYKKTLYSRVC